MKIIYSNENLISITLKERIDLNDKDKINKNLLRSISMIIVLSVDTHPYIVLNRLEIFPKQKKENLSYPNYIQLELIWNFHIEFSMKTKTKSSNQFTWWYSDDREILEWRFLEWLWQRYRHWRPFFHYVWWFYVQIPMSVQQDDEYDQHNRKYLNITEKLLVKQSTFRKQIDLCPAVWCESRETNRLNLYRIDEKEKKSDL